VAWRLADADRLRFSADPLKLPERIHLGEAAGVATNSKGNLSCTRAPRRQRDVGASRTFTHGGSRLFEFDRTGKFVREIGEGCMASSLRKPCGGRPDISGRGPRSSMVIDSLPMAACDDAGRKPEACRRGRAAADQPGTGVRATTSTATDVAWMPRQHLVPMIWQRTHREVRSDGRFLKSWARAAQAGQFDLPLSVAPMRAATCT